MEERALYRRLINETNIAQDGIRFIFYFGSAAHSEGRSLDQWRRIIDREIEDAKYRRALSAGIVDTGVDLDEGDLERALSSDEERPE